ncbi:SDR family oxidoreductase [Mycolicibacterium komossense]|uniref:SDR family oxidoreductase n=1 Tax=Mycolicibacterium komossense TaxID=1779 RepID=A0ABT3CLY7_9MYCO|nr:SDR family oxidoreductase [Mycolicibacterium komossense]MCV7230411.1 SDR family oxidoreductase [Mycolicibacterium komossense]
MLCGKVVMITGAARGIGASMARLLHQRGARLVLVDIDEHGVRALAGELGDDVVVFADDVNDFDTMQAAAETAVTRFGAIDVVVANAGVEHWAPVLTVEPEAFRRVIETNLIGVFNTVRAALPSIIAHRGYVLVVASTSSYTALPGMAAYGASKAGVEQFANVLRIEVAHHGVGVGSAHMSLVDTPMLRETRSSSPEFTTLLAALPRPARRTVTADKCAARLVDAIDKRKRRVDVPRWVAAARWLKPALSSPLGDRALSRQVARIEALSPGG